VANLIGALWRKSTRSTGGGGNCVEVAQNLPGVVGVRDSKDPAGGTLTVSPAAWSMFTAAVKAEQYART
jgi:hypothetical protein